MRYLSSFKEDRYASRSLRANAVSHKQIDAAENVEMLILHFSSFNNFDHWCIEL